MPAPLPSPLSVTIVGLGTIGSHVAPLVTRMPVVRRVTLVDPGAYETTNVVSQSMTAGEVGKSKAKVQALRLRRIRPSVSLEAFSALAEDVPLGQLRASVILGCVDNRAARQFLNQTARHLGVPYVDAGILADGQLARVSVILPGDGHACLECGWDQADYDALEQRYPCQPSGQRLAPASGAPAELGALAAALQATECARLLRGEPNDRGSHEIVLSADVHSAVVTRFRRNAECRLADHAPRKITCLHAAPDALTFGRALGLGSAAPLDPSAGALTLDGAPFVVGMTCLGCGRAAPALKLARALTGKDRTCNHCKGRLEAVGAQLTGMIGLADGGRGAGDRSLRALGLDTGDVFGIARGDEIRWFELAGD